MSNFNSCLKLLIAFIILHLNGLTDGFLNTIFQNINLAQPHHSTPSSKQGFLQMTFTANQPFNPFTARQKNTKIKWFETDLESFYSFVQSQPLLTPEQEFLYGRTIRMWTQVEHIRSQLRKRQELEDGSNCSISDEQLGAELGCAPETIQKIYRCADISKTKLVNSNLKLVLAVVSRYRTASIPNAELIAEGTRGLSKAVVRYDYSKGFRFATYATWYVHQAISEHVRWRKHPAKMPSRYLVLHREVKQFSSDFRSANKRFPTVAEISEHTGGTPFDIVKVLSMNSYPQLMHQSLNSKASYKGDSKERTYEDIIPSLYLPPLVRADNKDLRRDMEQMFQVNLNDAERDILRLRLGLDDGKEKPLKEVGRRFQISWKQVRNLEKDALSKLLVSSEIDEFVDHYHTVV